MLPVKVRITPAALADLETLHEPMLARVNRAIERLGDWPNVSGAKQLRGELKGHFRVRAGDWRIVFTIAGGAVVVVRIAKRRDVYQD